MASAEHSVPHRRPPVQVNDAFVSRFLQPPNSRLHWPDPVTCPLGEEMRCVDTVLTQKAAGKEPPGCIRVSALRRKRLSLTEFSFVGRVVLLKCKKTYHVWVDGNQGIRREVIAQH